MSVFKERAERRYQIIEDQAKMPGMLRQYAAGKTYMIKGFYEKIEVKVLDFKDPNCLIIDSLRDLEGELTLYHTFNKQLEIVGAISDKLPGNQYKFSVAHVKIAANERKSARYAMSSDLVVVNNIRAARNTINASLFNVPTSVKIHLEKFQQRLKDFADEVKVKIFEKDDEKTELVRKTMKILMIHDTQDLLSYMPEDTDGFVDYREHLNTEIGTVMEDYRKKKIVSEMIVPIIYLGHDGASIPLGFIQLISHEKKLGIDTALELKMLAFEMVDQMRDSNTMLINKRQSIADISRGGMRLVVTDPELKKFLVHQKGFSFDVIFKLQQPITVFTQICYTGYTPQDDLAIGVAIKGFSSRKGESDRYHQYIDNLAKTP
ncbi:DUF1577 domain-containing protein [Turneriella parva]|uniref:DUF1577 domain-containing protein n=1 Tax=Turneriella parva (strain ATCC BAA-1111 / DSM 21527 / NCTC 11395 / H) TaxID=869212 RepID=I4B0K0_TURPD|nr:DUF1577 domain-containing protein [Turneriella parva]AFM10807.1 protein of unknown function DUF1577 [Turneriella parva DSM 21527]